PAIVTWAALVAVTVKVDEPPDVMEAGLPLMATVGELPGLLRCTELHPRRIRASESGTALIEREINPCSERRPLCKMTLTASGAHNSLAGPHRESHRPARIPCDLVSDSRRVNLPKSRNPPN